MELDIQLNEFKYIFRSDSELRRENKGGYIEGRIVFNQIDFHDIDRLQLYLVETSQGGVHPNILFVTESKKKDCVVPKHGMTKDDINLCLKFKEDQILVKQSHLTDDGLCLGKSVWINNSLILGKNGLRLTVVKPKQKGINSNDVSLLRSLAIKLGKDENDAAVKNIVSYYTSLKSRKNPEVSKGSLAVVHLAVDCYLHDGRVISTICPRSILDKPKHEFKVFDVLPRTICPNPCCLTLLLESPKAELKEDQFLLAGQNFQLLERKQGFIRLFFPSISIGAPNFIRFLDVDIKVKPHVEGDCDACDIFATALSKLDAKKADMLKNKLQLTTRKRRLSSPSDKESEKRTLIDDFTQNLMPSEQVSTPNWMYQEQSEIEELIFDSNYEGPNDISTDRQILENVNTPESGVFENSPSNVDEDNNDEILGHDLFILDNINTDQLEETFSGIDTPLGSDIDSDCVRRGGIVSQINDHEQSILIPPCSARGISYHSATTPVLSDFIIIVILVGLAIIFQLWCNYYG